MNTANSEGNYLKRVLIPVLFNSAEQRASSSRQILLRFCLGVAFGWCFLVTVRGKIGMIDNYWQNLVAIVVVTAFAVGVTSCTYVRAVSWSFWPHLSTHHGRRILYAHMVALIITGPVRDMSEGWQPMQSNFNCVGRSLTSFAESRVTFFLAPLELLSDASTFDDILNEDLPPGWFKAPQNEEVNSGADERLGRSKRFLVWLFSPLAGIADVSMQKQIDGEWNAEKAQWQSMPEAHPPFPKRMEYTRQLWEKHRECFDEDDYVIKLADKRQINKCTVNIDHSLVFYPHEFTQHNRKIYMEVCKKFDINMQKFCRFAVDDYAKKDYWLGSFKRLAGVVACDSYNPEKFEASMQREKHLCMQRTNELIPDDYGETIYRLHIFEHPEKFMDVPETRTTVIKNVTFEEFDVTTLVLSASDLVMSVKDIILGVFVALHFVSFVQVFEAFVSLIFIYLVIHSAHSYVSEYLRDLAFENSYSTGYLLEIDARRKMESRSSVLPLRPNERLKKYSTLRLSRKEMSRMLRQYMLLGLAALFSAFVCTLADSQYHLSMSVFEIAKLQIHHSMSTEFHIQVEGNGSIASTLRKLFAPFSNTATTERRASFITKECLVEPAAPQAVMSGIYYCFAANALLIALSNYLMRLCTIFCDLTYPRRARARAMYLYNGFLMQRILSKQRAEIRARLLLQHDFSEGPSQWDIIVNRFWFLIPTGLRRCFTKKFRCSLCNYKLSIPDSFIDCNGCSKRFCRHCWCDMEEICKICKQ